MRILIAASIYPPEVGGPSFYAASLKEALERLGHTVTVRVLSEYKRFPSGIRHAFFALELFRASRKADVIIAFDVHATGLPATLIARMRRIPNAIRIGGDFLWEHYVNRTGDLLPLPRFYAHRERWNAKERSIFSLERYVVRRSLLVFSSQWIADIWRDPYELGPKQMHVIENAIPAKLPTSEPARKNFLLYGRQIPLKNAAAFRRAFEKAKEGNGDIELEEGVLAHAMYLEKLKGAYAVVVPSVSEVTPNAVIDSIRAGKPFLLTKYSGYASEFGEFGGLVDPLDEADMARGIQKLADPIFYKERRDKIDAFNEVRTYDDVAREFVALIGKSV